jgi:hypothetical protein
MRSRRAGTDVVSRICCLSGILMDDADDLRQNLLVELDVALELVDDRARHRLGLDLFAEILGEDDGLGLVVVGAVAELLDPGPRGALDQHLHGAVRQLQQLQYARERPHFVDGIGGRIIVGSILLRGKQNIDIRTHDLLQRADRLFATYEQGNNHVGKYHNVAQRQHRIGAHLTSRGDGARFRLGCHDPDSLSWLPSRPHPVASADPECSVTARILLICCH